MMKNAVIRPQWRFRRLALPANGRITTEDSLGLEGAGFFGADALGGASAIRCVSKPAKI